MAEPANRDREFARAFLALHFDPEGNVFKSGVEVLCRALGQAREKTWKAAIERCAVVSG